MAKILHVSKFYYPMWSTGGVARACYNLTRHLAELNEDVTVYTTAGYSPKDIAQTGTTVDVDGVNTVYFDNLSTSALNYKIDTPYRLFSYLPELDQFDVIHLHEHRTAISTIIGLSAIHQNIPVVIQPHGSLGYDRGHTKFKKSFDTLIGNKLISEADSLIASNSSELSEFNEFNIELAHTLPIGISPSSEPIPDRSSFRTRFGISNDDFLICFVGRLSNIKRIPDVVEAISNLHSEQKSNIRFVIVGPDDGAKREITQKINSYQLESNVILTGPLYNEEKYEVYLESDLFVLFSRFESFSTTVLEAGICSLPVLLSKKCWISSTLREHNAAFVADDDDLTETIEYVLENPVEASEVGKNLYELVHSCYTWEEIAKNAQEIYNSLI